MEKKTMINALVLLSIVSLSWFVYIKSDYSSNVNTYLTLSQMDLSRTNGLLNLATIELVKWTVYKESGILENVVEILNDANTRMDGADEYLQKAADSQKDSSASTHSLGLSLLAVLFSFHLMLWDSPKVQKVLVTAILVFLIIAWTNLAIV